MPNLDLYYRKCVIGGRRSFRVVANDFKSFGRAIRRKLILEIVGWPGTEKQQLVQSLRNAGESPVPVSRVAPPCNAGEKRRRSWMDEF